MTLKDIKRLYVNLSPDTVITDKTHFAQITSNYHFIKYRHYGSSAVRHNLKAFIWLMKTIFKDYQVDDFIILDRKTYDELNDAYWSKLVKAYYGN